MLSLALGVASAPAKVIIAGDVIDAATAHAWGIVQYLCASSRSRDSSLGRGSGRGEGAGGPASPAASPLDAALNLAKRLLRQSPAAVEVAKHTIDGAGAGEGGTSSSLYRERVGEGALYQLKHVPNATIAGTAIVSTSVVLPPMTQAAVCQSSSSSSSPSSLSSSFASAVARAAEEAVCGALASGHAVLPDVVSSGAAARQTGYVTLHVHRRLACVWRRLYGPRSSHGGQVRGSAWVRRCAELEDALARQLHLSASVCLRVTTAAHGDGGHGGEGAEDDDDDEEEDEEEAEEEDVSFAALQAAAVWCGHAGHSDRFAVVLSVSPATGPAPSLHNDCDNGVGTRVHLGVSAVVLWRRSHESALGGLPSTIGGQLRTLVCCRAHTANFIVRRCLSVPLRVVVVGCGSCQLRSLVFSLSLVAVSSQLRLQPDKTLVGAQEHCADGYARFVSAIASLHDSVAVREQDSLTEAKSAAATLVCRHARVCC
jgi:hypothetical protein